MEGKKQKVYDVLKKLDINYELRNHPAVFTCVEATRYTSDLVGTHCKNIFLRNRKGNKHYLVTIEENKKLNMKKLEEKLSEKNLSFASEKRMIKYLDLTPGSVSIFGLINDIEKEIIVILDNDLLNEKYINFHPNDNTATITISIDDFNKFLDWSGNEVNKIDIS